MHQDVILDACIEEYLFYSGVSSLKENSLSDMQVIVLNSIKRMAKKYISLVVEYADDISDPIEYTEFGSKASEMDIFDYL